MKKLIKSVAWGMLILFTSVPSVAADNEPANLLIGKWISNKQASIQEMRRAGISQEEIERLSPLFGHLELDIKNDVYTTILNSLVTSMPYSIISVTDDCYQLRMEQDVEVMCIINGMLHVPSYKGSNEVFDKRL